MMRYRFPGERTEAAVTVVRVRLTGDDAELGKITAIDVARLLQGFERAVARAAAGIAGRRPGQTGRRGKAVETATRFLLEGIEQGSVTAVLELPPVTERPDGLGVEDVALGDAALQETLDVLEYGVANPDVAEALAFMAEELDIGGRFKAVGVQLFDGGTPGRSSVLDRGKRQSLRQLADSRHSERPDALYGILFEANFEKRTAQLRLPTGQSVTVSFNDELADAVKEALRERAHVEGVVAYNVESAEALSIELRSVRRAEQQELGLIGGEFWRERSLEELAAEQGVEPLADPDELRDDEATDEEVAAFLEALGR